MNDIDDDKMLEKVRTTASRVDDAIASALAGIDCDNDEYLGVIIGKLSSAIVDYTVWKDGHKTRAQTGAGFLLLAADLWRDFSGDDPTRTLLAAAAASLDE